MKVIVWGIAAAALVACGGGKSDSDSEAGTATGGASVGVDDTSDSGRGRLIFRRKHRSNGSRRAGSTGPLLLPSRLRSLSSFEEPRAQGSDPFFFLRCCYNLR